MDPVVQQIKDACNLSEVIGRFVPLQFSNGKHKACCPFHQEKTPSFVINEEQQFYYCYGCGATGDVFTFLQAMEGKTFPELLEELAQQYQVSLPSSQNSGQEWNQEKQHINDLFQLNTLVSKHYTTLLYAKQEPSALLYLQNRGISAHTLDLFEIGTSSNQWDDLTLELSKNEGALEKATELGLIKWSTKAEKYFDLFRNRIVFPIHTPQGKVCGFGARRINDEDQPKYLNSFESKIFHKSQILYGLHLARTEIRKKGYALLVEGYMDVITLHQHNFSNAVATLGTSLSKEHCLLLKKTCNRMVLLFDGDQAGAKAVDKAIPILFETLLDASVVFLPKGEDPDSFLCKEGPDKLAELIEKKSQSIYDFWLNQLLDGATNNPLQMQQSIETAAKMVETIPDIYIQNQLLKKIGHKGNVHPIYLINTFFKTKRKYFSFQSPSPQEPQVRQRVEPSPNNTTQDDEIVLQLIGHFALFPELLLEISSQKIQQCIDFSTLQDVWAHFVFLVQEGSDKKTLLHSLQQQFMSQKRLQGKLQDFVMIGVHFQKEETKKGIEDILQTFEGSLFEKETKKINQEIKKAEEEGNKELANQLLKKKFERNPLK